MEVTDAVIGFAVALVVTAATTPLSARLARQVGAIDAPRERGLAKRETPLLGGLAILAGVLAAVALILPWDQQTKAIMGGAALITALGAIDDWRELPAGPKFLGQVLAVAIPVTAGVRVDNVTLPFAGPVDFDRVVGAGLTLIGIVAIVNVVNFSDGIDGLAAGVCSISAVAFSIIAFDLGRDPAAVLAAIVAGAALGFLIHNFHPASVFMGDSGAMLLGLLLGCVIVQGSVKTNAVLALIVPLVILLVPFLDTGFVVAKRIKYGKPIYSADRWHFHHRFVNIGFSQRRTTLYLYLWTFLLAGFAVALRFVPYSNDAGDFHTGWSLVIIGLGLTVAAASVYLVLVLEILKFKRVRTFQLRRDDPDTSEHQIEEEIVRELETGEWDAV